MSPRRNPPVRGFRADIRRALYQGFKYELGCPGETNCGLYAKSGTDACQPCSKHLKPVEAEPFAGSLRRLRLVFWLESLIEAGCRFMADEISAQLWEHLAAIKSERNRFERLLIESKDTQNRARREEETVRQQVRKLDGLPAPGQSLFGGKGKAPVRRR
jgi:hypothetical protein